MLHAEHRREIGLVHDGSDGDGDRRVLDADAERERERTKDRGANRRGRGPGIRRDDGERERVGARIGSPRRLASSSHHKRYNRK